MGKIKKSVRKMTGKDGVDFVIGPGGKEINMKEAAKILKMKRVYDAKD